MSKKPAGKFIQAKEVFLARGWDNEVISQLKDVLLKLGLCVVEWDDLVDRLKKPLPYNLEVVKRALDDCTVFVILLTPDEITVPSEHVCDSPEKLAARDKKYFQVRPNVLLEAGMALGRGLETTVIVEVGGHRQMSDIDGLNVVRTQDQGWPVRFAQRLRIAFNNAGEVLLLDDDVLADLGSFPAIVRPKSVTVSPSPLVVQVEVPEPTITISPPPGTLSPDPVNRREKLLQVFRDFGGPTSARWRFDPDAPDYKVMKDAEAEDERNPLTEGTRVYVQQHYESEYNGKIGTVMRYNPEKHFCSVEFPPEAGLARKTFHVMYLSGCK